VSALPTHIHAQNGRAFRRHRSATTPRSTNISTTVSAWWTVKPSMAASMMKAGHANRSTMIDSRHRYDE
jgi:hypothetical protein